MTNVQSFAQTHPQSDTVLCLHASAGSGRSWRALAAALSPRFEVITPDRLGCASDVRWTPGAPAPFAAEVRHLAPILDAYPEGVHLVGHSYGGAVALEIALRRPDRIKSLTLYEPVRFAWLFKLHDADAERSEILRLGHTVSWFALSGRFSEAAAMFVDYWSGAGTWASMDARRQQAIAYCMPKVGAEFEAAFSDRTTLGALRALTMPVCLIGGDTSPAPVKRIGALLADYLPHAEVATLHGVGHMGPVTHPDQFASRLPRWLRMQATAIAA